MHAGLCCRAARGAELATRDSSCGVRHAAHPAAPARAQLRRPTQACTGLLQGREGGTQRRKGEVKNGMKHLATTAKSTCEDSVALQMTPCEESLSTRIL